MKILARTRIFKIWRLELCFWKYTEVTFHARRSHKIKDVIR